MADTTDIRDDLKQIAYLLREASETGARTIDVSFPSAYGTYDARPHITVKATWGK